MRAALLALLSLVALAQPVAAHDAFGDLGPFYRAALHPLADPAQGLLLVAAALMLARQPLATVRRAYISLVIGAFATIALGTVLTLPVPGLRGMALASLALAAAAILAPRNAPSVVLAAAAGIGALAALPLDVGSGGRAALLGRLGGAIGIALVTLFLWGLAEWADRRISPLTSRVAAAWVAAIALMAAVLPA